MEDETKRIEWLVRVGEQANAAKAVADAAFYARTQVRQGHNDEHWKTRHNEHIKDALNELVRTIGSKDGIGDLISLRTVDDAFKDAFKDQCENLQGLGELIGVGAQPEERVRTIKEIILSITKKMSVLQQTRNELRAARSDLKRKLKKATDTLQHSKGMLEELDSKQLDEADEAEEEKADEDEASIFYDANERVRDEAREAKQIAKMEIKAAQLWKLVDMFADDRPNAGRDESAFDSPDDELAPPAAPTAAPNDRPNAGRDKPEVFEV